MAVDQVVTERVASLIIEIKNLRPIELGDFASSLHALGNEFSSFATNQSGADGDAKLYIKEIRPGSTIVELVRWAAQSAIEGIKLDENVIGPFMANWQETLKAILNLSDDAKKLPKSSVKNARAFVEPIAKDNGSQVNIIANDGANVTVFNVSSGSAAQIAYNANHLLAEQMPEETRFQDEPMVLWQVRDGPPAKTGDMGRIDRFSEKARKITFGSDSVKGSIMERDENPFGYIFFVSGVVKTAGGRIVAYHILALESSIPKEDG